LPRLPRVSHIRASPAACPLPLASSLLLTSSPRPKHRFWRRIHCVYAMLKPGSCLAGVWGRLDGPGARRCSTLCLWRQGRDSRTTRLRERQSRRRWLVRHGRDRDGGQVGR
jgi:hypothetical protein